MSNKTAERPYQICGCNSGQTCVCALKKEMPQESAPNLPSSSPSLLSQIVPQENKDQVTSVGAGDGSLYNCQPHRPNQVIQTPNSTTGNDLYEHDSRSSYLVPHGDLSGMNLATPSLVCCTGHRPTPSANFGIFDTVSADLVSADVPSLEEPMPTEALLETFLLPSLLAPSSTDYAAFGHLDNDLINSPNEYASMEPQDVGSYFVDRSDFFQPLR